MERLADLATANDTASFSPDSQNWMKFVEIDIRDHVIGQNKSSLLPASRVCNCKIQKMLC